jgi:TrmH family RNA methyltransferase
VDSLSASLRKEVASLGSAKHRRELGAFIVEGTRCVADTMPHFSCRYMFATAQWLEQNPKCRPANADAQVVQVSQTDINRMSQQQTPQPVLAVLNLPTDAPFAYTGQMTLALDGVQNPGNLGTIVRLADWFGITDIIASSATADLYNPKVVQATMGALARVKLHRVDSLADTLAAIDAPVYGTFLDGRNLYSCQSLPLTPRPVIVMGNEGNGISPEVEAVVTERLLIPSFPPGRTTSESLNVAMATGIIVGELSRRIYG